MPMLLVALLTTLVMVLLIVHRLWRKKAVYPIPFTSQGATTTCCSEEANCQQDTEQPSGNYFVFDRQTEAIRIQPDWMARFNHNHDQAQYSLVSFLQLIQPDDQCRFRDALFRKKKENFLLRAATAEGIEVSIRMMSGEVDDNTVAGTLMIEDVPSGHSLTLEEAQPNHGENQNISVPSIAFRLWVLDDHPVVSTYLQNLFSGDDIIVTALYSAMDFHDRITSEESNPDLLMCDLNLPDMNGFVLIESLRKNYPDMPVLLCTGDELRVDVDRVKSLGLVGVMGKPVDVPRLRMVIDSLRP